VAAATLAWDRAELFAGRGALLVGATGLRDCEGGGEKASATAAGGGELLLSGTAALVGALATCGSGKRDMRAINLRHCAAFNTGAGCRAREAAELPASALADVAPGFGARGERPTGRVAGCGTAAVNATSSCAAESRLIGAPAATCKPAGPTICSGLKVGGSASSLRIASAANEPPPCWRRTGTRLNAEMATASPLACSDLVADVAMLRRSHWSAETVG
jgi:hypothetical protein